MKLKTFQMGVGLMSLLSLSAHAMNFEEETTQKNPSRIILQEIKTTQETLDDFNNRNSQIPISEKNRYEEYIKELVKLYNRAKGDEKMNVKEELFYLSNKYF